MYTIDSSQMHKTVLDVSARGARSRSPWIAWSTASMHHLAEVVVVRVRILCR